MCSRNLLRPAQARYSAAEYRGTLTGDLREKPKKSQACIVNDHVQTWFQERKNGKAGSPSEERIGWCWPSSSRRGARPASRRRAAAAPCLRMQINRWSEILILTNGQQGSRGELKQ